MTSTTYRLPRYTRKGFDFTSYTLYTVTPNENGKTATITLKFYKWDIPENHATKTNISMRWIKRYGRRVC